MQCQCQCYLQDRDLTRDEPAIGFDALPHNAPVSWAGSLAGTYLEVPKSPCTSAAGRKVWRSCGHLDSPVPESRACLIRKSGALPGSSGTVSIYADQGGKLRPRDMSGTHALDCNPMGTSTTPMHLYQNPQSLRTDADHLAAHRSNTAKSQMVAKNTSSDFGEDRWPLSTLSNHRVNVANAARRGRTPGLEPAPPLAILGHLLHQSSYLEGFV
jgi:hypothetical protein